MDLSKGIVSPPFYVNDLGLSGLNAGVSVGNGNALGGLFGLATDVLTGGLGSVANDLLSPIINIFDNSTPISGYTKHADYFINTVVPRYKSEFANDLSSLFTALDKGVTYMILFYKEHRKYATGQASVPGTQAGLDSMIAFRDDLRSRLSNASNLTVKSNDVRHTFKDAYYQGMTFSGGAESHTGIYKKYDVKAKSNTTTNVDTIVAPVSPTSNNTSGQNMDFKLSKTAKIVIGVVLIVPIVATLIYKLVKRKK
jgi:hypothetical protein